VVLYVGASDRFPYFVEYRGGDQAGIAAADTSYAPARDSLASFEFIEVQFASVMPAEIFQFTPPDNRYQDITVRLYVELCRPQAATAMETTTAQRDGTWR
jgi:hypothetical protein